MVKCRKSIESLSPYVPGRPIDDVKREYGLSEVVKLASNETPYGASPLAVEAARNALSDIYYYPDGACGELRSCLAESLGVTPIQICVGSGADEIISMLARAFIETGDEAIAGEVTFGQYAAGVVAMGGDMRYVPMIGNGYDLQGILAAVTPKTKMIFVANPNNPTGTLITDEEKTAFLDKVPNEIMVVFDEAYQEFVETDSFTSSVPLIAKYDNLVVLKTFSKIYGLASLRVGYGVMSEEHANLMEKIRLPFNVSTPAQKAAVAALEDSAFVAEARSRNIEVKHFCYKELDRLGLSYIESETNFIMVKIDGDSMDMFADLMKAGYIIRAGKPFGLPNHIRVTLGTMEQMKGFFAALKQLIQR